MATETNAEYDTSSSARQEKGVDIDTFLKFSAIPGRVQQHLLKVYGTLAGCLFIVSLGAALHMVLGVGGLLTFLGSLVTVTWLASIPRFPGNQSLRLRLLLATALLQGCTIGPLIQTVADIDPSPIGAALLGSAAVFAAFSGAALLSRRREFLFLGGLLGSALSTILTMRLASLIFGTQMLQFQIELYGGLLIFSGYVVFDTQVMIERALAGTADYIQDALQLLLDFIAIFVRLLIILAKKDDRRESRGEKRRSSSTTRR